MKYGNQFDNTKTFYEWCLANNRMDLNDRFDVELNKCTTHDVGYKSNKKWYFKCPRGIHNSELYFMSFVTKDPKKDLACRKCNSLAQVVIDRFGQEYLDLHWHPDNSLNPWEIAAGSSRGNIKVKIQCDKKFYHIYDQVPASFAKGIGCPYCINRKVHPLDSFGATFPEILERWSDKNTKSPYEYAPHSAEKVWFKCPDGKHEDYLQKIANAVIYDFTCRRCENEKMGLQKRGENSRFWCGGINGENDAIRHRFEYKNWRTNVYERDKYTCQCCGNFAGRLNAHHIYQFSDYENLRYNEDNGITLCTKCHDSTEEGSFHNIYGTHNTTPDQLREYILNKSNIDIYQTHPQILTLTTQQNN